MKYESMRLLYDRILKEEQLAYRFRQGWNRPLYIAIAKLQLYDWNFAVITMHMLALELRNGFLID